MCKFTGVGISFSKRLLQTVLVTKLFYQNKILLMKLQITTQQWDPCLCVYGDKSTYFSSVFVRGSVLDIFLGALLLLQIKMKDSDTGSSGS